MHPNSTLDKSCLASFPSNLLNPNTYSVKSLSLVVLLAVRSWMMGLLPPPLASFVGDDEGVDAKVFEGERSAAVSTSSFWWIESPSIINFVGVGRAALSSPTASSHDVGVEFVEVLTISPVCSWVMSRLALVWYWDIWVAFVWCAMNFATRGQCSDARTAIWGHDVAFSVPFSWADCSYMYHFIVCFPKSEVTGEWPMTERDPQTFLSSKSV